MSALIKAVVTAKTNDKIINAYPIDFLFIFILSSTLTLFKRFAQFYAGFVCIVCVCTHSTEYMIWLFLLFNCLTFYCLTISLNFPFSCARFFTKMPFAETPMSFSIFDLMYLEISSFLGHCSLKSMS